MGDILTEIVSLLTNGLSTMATGIGSGLNALVTNIFIDNTGDSQKLSVFGGVIIVFAGIALAIGLSRFVVGFIQRLGK